MAQQEIDDTPQAPKINPLMRNMLKGFIPLVSKSLPQVNVYLANYLAGVKLEVKETKAGIVCMTGTDGEAYFLTVAFADDTIVRIINRVSAVEFIQTLIKQF